jgi:Asp-tRNA(Asn)/Glu-tRNA(Gln) amidotransferase A subunit family amidase
MTLGAHSCARVFVVFFEEAKEDALKLDAEFAATGRLKGPLHGVPISVKDQCMFSRPFLRVTGADEMWDTVVDVKGFDSTIGYTQWANKPAERDAAVRSPNLLSPLPSPIALSLSTPLTRPPAYRSSRCSAQRVP